MFERGYYCYKWIQNGEIVYIGKTVTPKLRIAQEKRQEKFRDYLDADIYVTEFKNRTEMDGMEKLLINKYQPVLNVVDTNDLSMELPIDDSTLNWVLMTDVNKEEKLRYQIAKLLRDIEFEEENASEAIEIQQVLELSYVMYCNSITRQTFEGELPSLFSIADANNTGIYLSNIMEEANKDIDSEEYGALLRALDEEELDCTYIRIDSFSGDHPVFLLSLCPNDKQMLYIYNKYDDRDMQQIRVFEITTDYVKARREIALDRIEELKAKLDALRTELDEVNIAA